MRRTLTEVIENLTEVIRLQNEIIREALMLLLQHVATEDEAMIEIIGKLEYVKGINRRIEADPLEDEGLPFNLPERPGEKRNK